MRVRAEQGGMELGGCGAGEEGRQTKTHPGAWERRGALFGILRARRERGSERMEEWRREPALWRCAWASDSWPGRRAGWWWAASRLGGVRKCGRRDSKSAWLAEPKNRLVGDVVGRLAGLFFAASTARKNRKKEEKECLAPGLAFLLSGPATKRVKLSGGCLVSACLEGPQHRCRRDGCPTKFRDQVPKLAAHSLHRHLSTATRPVVLRKMRECGSWVPGCVRRTCSGSNGSKRGVNPPKAQQVLELLISGDSESGEDLGPVKSPRQRESAAGQGMALMS